MLQPKTVVAPLHRPGLEGDACGVALVADATGRASRAIVERALLALDRLAHRGASGAETHAVDGAGVLTQIPWAVLERETPQIARLDRPRALGAFFFARDAEDEGRRLVERTLTETGWQVAAWREVPVDADAVDARVVASAPAFWHAVIRPRGATADDATRRLLGARLRIRAEAARRRMPGLAVVSLSTTTVVYKGLLAPADLPRFFLDLADQALVSSMVLAHQRFSTNTFPRWELAQPFRLLAHNGEINTIAGNRAWMRARQRDRATLPGWDELAFGPIVTSEGSDSESLDDMLALLVASGLGVPHAIARLVPPAWEHDPHLPADVRAFYEFQAGTAEPWDGPAALAFADGVVAGVALDRNGFRPMRFLRLANGQVFAGSEAGLFDVRDEDVVERGRLGPGDVLLVDTARGLVRQGAAVRRTLALTRPYRRWLDRAMTRLADAAPALTLDAPDAAVHDDAEWRRLLRRFGCDREELEVIVRALATDGREAVGSMGDDTPPAALGTRPRLLSDFFRQRFAQVTNPPMDPWRERAVMSLATLVGRRGHLLEEGPHTFRLVALDSPVVVPADLERLVRMPRLTAVTLSTGFDAAAGVDGLSVALATLEDAVVEAVRGGASVLVLSDARLASHEAVIPALLAVAAVHRRLFDMGLRLQASLVADTGEARDAHQVATLVGFGASAVCPRLGCLAAMRFAAPGVTPAAAEATYRRALEDGLLKIFSKMGVSTASGYCGAALFETLGLAPDVVSGFFPDAPAHPGSTTIEAIAQAALARHASSVEDEAVLRHVGFHGFRRDGDYHAYNPDVVKRLHKVAVSQTAEAYDHFASAVHARPLAAVRDLVRFREATPVPIDEVEPVEAICRRFFASAMSVGALSPEAHRTIAIAMNAIGGRSNSGEGGEAPERRADRHHPTASNSETKQVASGRFGVTPGYLLSASELQIKMAQGSKPGEGGQLPAAKVVDHIARLRHARPGTALISPPPHHDIYSIEDLAQLIHDLRALHPSARIGVKLVASLGVGIIAAGVAKAGADAVQVSGHDGGTGASPRGSIKHAGMPWEIGVAEAHQVLTLNGLRSRVVLQADGGFKTGRDVVMAAALGAEEFGFGTAGLVAIGCVMARQCHLNTCPVGIASQRADLRGKFTGTPEQAIAFFRLLAEDVRRQLAELGLRSMAELVGRADLLQPAPGLEAGIDVSGLLASAASVGATAPRATSPTRRGRAQHVATPSLNDRIVAALADEVGTRPTEWESAIRNTDRTVGARLAGLIAERWGDAGAPAPIRLSFTGSAGQSFGAFSLPGMSMVLTGEANDFVGKSMHGGEIVVRPAAHRDRPADRLAGATADPPADVLVGNGVLYGATGGTLLVAGRAGERFAVRNSGATAVVEGVGDHGCEYMTGGLVVVLGPVGRNFAAGMTGGVAYVLDEAGQLGQRLAGEAVMAPLAADDEARLRALLEAHLQATGSRVAARLFGSGEAVQASFRRVRPIGDEPAEQAESAATA